MTGTNAASLFPWTELFTRLRGGAHRARHAAGKMDRDDLVPLVEQRLVDGEEVADRGLGCGRQVGLTAQARVVVVEVLDIEREHVWPFHHDGKPIDGDAGAQHVVAHLRDERTAVVGAVARYVDDATDAIVAARIEQRFRKLQRARNLRPRRTPICRARDFVHHAVGRVGSVDQAPGNEGLRSAVELGRAEMSDELQVLCFFAGANSIFYGEKLLTTGNPDVEHDQRLFARLGVHAMEITTESHTVHAGIVETEIA